MSRQTSNSYSSLEHYGVSLSSVDSGNASMVSSTSRSTKRHKRGVCSVVHVYMYMYIIMLVFIYISILYCYLRVMEYIVVC